MNAYAKLTLEETKKMLTGVRCQVRFQEEYIAELEVQLAASVSMYLYGRCHAGKDATEIILNRKYLEILKRIESQLEKMYKIKSNK